MLISAFNSLNKTHKTQPPYTQVEVPPDDVKAFQIPSGFFRVPPPQYHAPPPPYTPAPPPPHQYQAPPPPPQYQAPPPPQWNPPPPPRYGGTRKNHKRHKKQMRKHASKKIRHNK